MFTKVLLIALSSAVVQGIEYYHGHGHHDEYQHEPAHYSFNYQVYDHKTGDIKSHQEERQGDATKGEYSLIEPDGSKRTVQYTVDKHSGFNAVVHREGSHHSAPSHHGYYSGNYGNAASYHSYSTHSAPSYSHVPIIAHHAPLISHHAPIISHHAPIVSHHAPIVSHHAPIIASHGHATSSQSFSTHGAKILTQTYHHAPLIKKIHY